MKLQSLNYTRQQNVNTEHANSKKKNPSFGNPAVAFATFIENNGFLGEFLSIDTFGMMAPRTGQGYLRNRKELGHLNYKAGREEYDVVIATSWESFYRLNKFRAYKMYFVQDYEPYFSKFNEKFLLAKKTYELGAHIVSLGSWNIEMIRKECNTTSKLDALRFPYEPNEYSLSVKRNYLSYAHKKCLKIAVYTKEEGKRIPNILQYILKKASEDFEKKGIKLDINFFGLKNNYAVSIGNNLGKLTKKQLVELYNNCDFGMCASMTNISLVPYEMLATGLPVVEFSDGSYSDFLPETSATLIDYNYHTLVMKLEELLKNPKIIEKQIETGRTALEKLSWENTASEFDKILQSLLEK